MRLGQAADLTITEFRSDATSLWCEIDKRYNRFLDSLFSFLHNQDRHRFYTLFLFLFIAIVSPAAYFLPQEQDPSTTLCAAWFAKNFSTLSLNSLLDSGNGNLGPGFLRPCNALKFCKLSDNLRS